MCNHFVTAPFAWVQWVYSIRGLSNKCIYQLYLKTSKDASPSQELHPYRPSGTSLRWGKLGDEKQKKSVLICFELIQLRSRTTVFPGFAGTLV